MSKDGPWQFTIDSPLIGHKCSVRANYDKLHMMHKERIRILAYLAGVPRELDPEGSYKVTMEIFWKKKQRIDAENVRKQAIDCLWSKDRRVVSGSYVAYENHGFELAKMTVEKLP
jgi:hypothetical protein